MSQVMRGVGVLSRGAGGGVVGKGMNLFGGVLGGSAIFGIFPLGICWLRSGGSADGG